MTIQRGGNGPTLSFNTGGRGSIIDAIDDSFLGNALIELNEIPSFSRTVLHHTADNQRLSWILNPSFEEPPPFHTFPDIDFVRHRLKFSEGLSNLLLAEPDDPLRVNTVGPHFRIKFQPSLEQTVH
jgi:hypothetical protein